MEKRASRVRSGERERSRAAPARSAIVRLGCSHASSPQPGQGHLLARPGKPQTSPGPIELECCSMAGKENLRKKNRKNQHIPVDKPHTRIISGSRSNDPESSGGVRFVECNAQYRPNAALWRVLVIGLLATVWKHAISCSDAPRPSCTSLRCVRYLLTVPTKYLPYAQR